MIVVARYCRGNMPFVARADTDQKLIVQTDASYLRSGGTQPIAFHKHTRIERK